MQHMDIGKMRKGKARSVKEEDCGEVKASSLISHSARTVRKLVHSHTKALAHRVKQILKKRS